MDAACTPQPGQLSHQPMAVTGEVSVHPGVLCTHRVVPVGSGAAGGGCCPCRRMIRFMMQFLKPALVSFCLWSFGVFPLTPQWCAVPQGALLPSGQRGASCAQHFQLHLLEHSVPIRAMAAASLPGPGSWEASAPAVRLLRSPCSPRGAGAAPAPAARRAGLMGLGSWLGLCSHLPHPVPCLQGAGVPQAGGCLQCSELLHPILTASTSAAPFCRGSEVPSGLPLAVGWVTTAWDGVCPSASGSQEQGHSSHSAALKPCASCPSVLCVAGCC